MLNKVYKFLKSRMSIQLVRNFLIVGSVTIVLKILGFYKDQLVAENFGLSEQIDTFLLALLLPTIVNSVFLTSYKSIFIPNYILELKSNGNIKSFQTSSFIITVSIGAFFTVLSYLFSDVYLELLFNGHTQDYYELVTLQLYFILPCIMIWSISSLLVSLLNIANEFFYSSFSSLFISLSIIVCLLFFKDFFGEKVLAIGMLIGTSIDLLFLLFIALKRKVLVLGIPSFKGENINQLLRQIPAKVSSSLFNGIHPLIDQYFSAQLVVGSIAALDYGLKIPAFIIGLIGITLGNVLLPYLSNIVAENKKNALHILKKLLKYNFFFCVAITTVLFFLSEYIITLIFQRNAFTEEDTKIVFRIQQMYLLQIPFYVVGIIINRYLTSINKNNFLVILSVIGLITNIILNILFLKLWGVFGLALATSVVSLLTSIIGYFYVLKIK